VPGKGRRGRPLFEPRVDAKTVVAPTEPIASLRSTGKGKGLRRKSNVRGGGPKGNRAKKEENYGWKARRGIAPGKKENGGETRHTRRKDLETGRLAKSFGGLQRKSSRKESAADPGVNESGRNHLEGVTPGLNYIHSNKRKRGGFD